MSETDLRKRIQLDLSVGNCRLFRNNVGEAWQGRAIRQQDGNVLLLNPSRVVYGLALGSADLIGWRSILITPDMVGCIYAVFSSIEVKAHRGRHEKGQNEWCEAVAQAGGFSGFAHSIEEARSIVDAQE